MRTTRLKYFVKKELCYIFSRTNIDTQIVFSTFCYIFGRSNIIHKYKIYSTLMVTLQTASSNLLELFFIIDTDCEQNRLKSDFPSSRWVLLFLKGRKKLVLDYEHTSITGMCITRTFETHAHTKSGKNSEASEVNLSQASQISFILKADQCFSKS